MKKAVLDLNSTVFENYQHLDLERSWRSVTSIRVWLLARQFDLDLPIFVTKEEKLNTLTFFQTKTDSGKNIVLVHPNPDVLNQLDSSLKETGYNIHAYSKVRAANKKIKDLFKAGLNLNSIVVPRNLKVHNGFTYKTYLNTLYPDYRVLTVDKKEYRDSLKDYYDNNP